MKMLNKLNKYASDFPSDQDKSCIIGGCCWGSEITADLATSIPAQPKRKEDGATRVHVPALSSLANFAYNSVKGECDG